MRNYQLQLTNGPSIKKQSRGRHKLRKCDRAGKKMDTTGSLSEKGEVEFIKKLVSRTMRNELAIKTESRSFYNQKPSNFSFSNIGTMATGQNIPFESGTKKSLCLKQTYHTDFPLYSDTGYSDTRSQWQFWQVPNGLSYIRMMWLQWHLLTVTLVSCPEGVTVSGEDFINQPK